MFAALPYSSWVVFAGWLLFILAFIGFRIFTGTSILGKPTITKGAYKTGKLAFFLAGIALIVQAAGVNLRFFTLSPPWELTATILIAVSFLLLIAAFAELGTSTRMGLPKEKTALKTGGLYTFSRHPMYVAMYMLLLASVLYTLNLIVLLLAFYAIFVHHKIALAEEKFLLDRFGKEYAEYSTRVRRYI